MRVQETDWGYIEWMEPEYPRMGSEEASLRTGTVYVEPGKTMLRHVHYEEQFVYVLEGRGIGYINGEPQIFEPGARFHMPAAVRMNLSTQAMCRWFICWWQVRYPLIRTV